MQRKGWEQPGAEAKRSDLRWISYEKNRYAKEMN
nr:MAG TPA: hypothetical protein [Caudoviricetes sp.]